MDSKCLLVLLVVISAASAEVVEYGQCSLTLTSGKIINLRKSKEQGGAIFLSSFHSDSLDACTHSCCNDTAGQCSVAVYHDSMRQDNCYHINCPDPESCVYQELEGYTLAVISRTIPQAEALGGTSTARPAVVTTKTTSTKSPNVIPQGRVATDKQQEIPATQEQGKPTTEQPPTTGAEQQTKPATQQPTGAQQQTKPGTQQPIPGAQQQTSSQQAAQQQTTTKALSTPKSPATLIFTQKPTTKTTTTVVIGKKTTEPAAIMLTTEGSKTTKEAIAEVQQTTQSAVAPTQSPTSKVQTVRVVPTDLPQTEKLSTNPEASTKPSTTISKITQAVSAKTNPAPDVTPAQTKASSTGQNPDITSADKQPPTSKPVAVTTKHLMLGSTAKEHHTPTQTSLVDEGSIDQLRANRTELIAPSDTMKKSSYGSLIVAMCFGLLFLFAVTVVVGKRWYESWQRRHYSKIDYLINGMYN